jgi:hypothetical protein
MAERPMDELSKRELMLGFRAMARMVREELDFPVPGGRKPTLAEMAKEWSDATPEEIFALERIKPTADQPVGYEKGPRRLGKSGPGDRIGGTLAAGSV